MRMAYTRVQAHAFATVYPHSHMHTNARLYTPVSTTYIEVTGPPRMHTRVLTDKHVRV